MTSFALANSLSLAAAWRFLLGGLRSRCPVALAPSHQHPGDAGDAVRQRHRGELERALGDQAYKIPISSIKSMIGHSLGGIGAVEMAACALAIDRGVVPPTANWENPDPECDLDYTPNEAKRTQVDAALSTGSGFGGFQSAMILARPSELQEVGI